MAESTQILQLGRGASGGDLFLEELSFIALFAATTALRVAISCHRHVRMIVATATRTIRRTLSGSTSLRGRSGARRVRGRRRSGNWRGSALCVVGTRRRGGIRLLTILGSSIATPLLALLGLGQGRGRRSVGRGRKRVLCNGRAWLWAVSTLLRGRRRGRWRRTTRTVGTIRRGRRSGGGGLGRSGGIAASLRALLTGWLSLGPRLSVVIHSARRRVLGWGLAGLVGASFLGLLRSAILWAAFWL